MSLKNGKCPNCNASLKFEAGKETVVCEYCRSTFFLNEFLGNTKKEEKPAFTPPPPVSLPPTQQTKPVNNDPWGFNTNTYSNKKIPPRPTINVVALVVLACFYVFPAFIYLVAIHTKQKEWDIKYGSRK